MQADRGEVAARSMRAYKGWMAWIVKAFSATVGLYSIVFAINIYDYYLHVHFFTSAYLALFLFFLLTLVFLLYPATKKAPRDRLPWYDLLLILITLLPTLYESFMARSIAEGSKVGATILDQTLFVLLLLVLFEGIRRTVGCAILGIILFFLGYTHFAYLLPGLWGAPRFSWGELTEYMYLNPSGIFGMILEIAATMIILFTIFGAFLIKGGAGRLLMDSALAIAGRYRGGPAKVAIVASSLFGMVSGSAAANVGTVGAITIPLMKRLGYPDYFAGAAVAVASTGGILTPPVMGAIAFIMGQVTGLGYQAVAIGAILPAALYYICLFFQLDFEAAKLGLVGLPRENLPSLGKALKKDGHLTLPIILLVILLVKQFDVLEAVLYATGMVVAVSWLRKETRMGFTRIVEALANGTQGVLLVGPVMAAVGVIFGALTLTGLTINLSALIRDLAGGNLWLLAILVWTFMYLAGFGVGEVVTYIVMAVIVASAFVKLGVPLLAAHMFIFIAGLSMFITPPNCPAVFVACSISGAGIWRTGFQAMKLGVLTFLMPFMLLLNPVLLMEGSPGEIIRAFITCVMAAYFIAASIEGYMLSKANWWQRLIFLVGGICLFIPGWRTDGIGLLLVLTPWLVQYATWRKTKHAARPSMLMRN